MDTPSPSPQKKGNQKKAQADEPVTPQTNATGSSIQARSRIRTRTNTPSSSSDAKITLNEENVRRNAEEQGMFFEDAVSYAKYPVFRKYIESTVFGSRGSALRDESNKKIQDWRAENATTNERTYLARVVSMVLKTARSVPNKKRTFQDDMIITVKSFDSDDLGVREDQLFVTSILPLRTPKDAAQLGLTTPKPDFVYGFKSALHPDLTQPLLSLSSKTFKNVAPGVDYAFFSVDGKGCSGNIEAAENQSQRSGATTVAALAALNDKGKGKLEVTKSNDTKQEDFGPDTNPIAFTCSWTPQLAKLHVHWRELRGEEIVIYHMNCLNIYRMGKKEDLSEFRKDVHNILDWGISAKRRDVLKHLEMKIAKNEEAGSVGS